MARPISPSMYSHEWWQVTLSSVGDAVIVTDNQGHVVFMNPVAENLTGWNYEEAANRPLPVVLPLIDELSRMPVENPVVRVLQTEATIELANRTVLLSKTGTEIFIDDSAAPIKDPNGNILGVVLIFRDVGEKKQREREKAYLAAIIESSDDAIVGKTLDGVITSWNRGAERIFGYSPKEAIGQRVYLLIPLDRHSEEEMILSRLRLGERIDHYETVRRRKDGELIDVSLTVSPIQDSEGHVIGASKIARDITARKKAEAQLAEGHATLETINEIGKLLASELDLKALVQRLIDAATRLTGATFGAFFYNVLDERGASHMLYALSGISPEHFAHFPMPRPTDLLGPTFRSNGVVRADDAAQDSRYGKHSPFFGMPESQLPVTSYLAVPVVSLSGEVLGGLFFGHPDGGVFKERHERIVAGLAGQAAIAMDNARLYEGMRRAREEAETANRLKDEFLATVSHELRTPLNAILGWARMLHTQTLDEQNREKAIEVIERNAVAQGQIIEDILDVSRIITGKLNLDIAPIDVSQLVGQSVESMRPTAEAKGIRLQAVLGNTQNLIWGDARRLQQILWNLLSNALKFTSKNGRVQVTVSKKNSHVEVLVSDTGKGIAPDLLPYVFDRFRQGDGSTKRTYGGLGLGLAIVRHLTELHGGTVTANSAGEGLGATFRVNLPVAALREDGFPLGNRAETRPTSPEAFASSQYELQGVRVLIVDDEPDARELIGTVLEGSGAEVRLASDAKAAMVIVTGWKPDVLLSDVGMPDQDGYSFIRQVRSLPHKDGGSIPAAALTAYASPKDRLRALTAGFQTHLSKPVEPRELIAVVAVLSGKTGTAKDR